MKTPWKGERDSRGFSLLELVIALIVFQVGVLAVAGMVILGQETMIQAELIMRGTVEAARTGDSLLSSGSTGDGQELHPWGSLAWQDLGAGHLRAVALGPGGADTLAVLLLWEMPPMWPPISDSVGPSAGGLP